MYGPDDWIQSLIVKMEGVSFVIVFIRALNRQVKC
jgi:hypothetical protein